MNIFKKSVAILSCATMVGAGMVAATGMVMPLDSLSPAFAAGDSFKVESTKVSFQRSVSKMLKGLSGGGGGGAYAGKITYSSNGNASSSWVCNPGDSNPDRTCKKSTYKNEFNYTYNKEFIDANVTPVSQYVTQGSGWIKCTAEKRNGYWVIPEGVVETAKKTTTKVYKDGKKVSETSNTTYGQASCVFAKVVTHNKTLDCVLTAKGSTTRTANSYLKKSAQIGSAKEQKYSGKGDVKNIKKESDCVTSDKVEFDFSGTVGRQQSNWGIYNVNLNLSVVRCRFGSSTFDGKKTNLVDCKNPTSRSDKTVFTIMCNNVYPYAKQSSWTGAECLTNRPNKPTDPKDPYDPKDPNPIKKPAAYQCEIPSPATYDGKSGNVQALRDGKLKNLVWGKPVLKGGLRADTNWRQTTKLLAGSTPNISNLSATDGKQLYKYSSGFNSSWKKMSARPTVNAAVRTNKLAFYTAGTNGKSFQLERQYKFDAQYQVYTYDVIAIKPGGKIIYGNRKTQWVPVKDSLCGPQKSPKISVLRAVGTQS